MNLDRQNIKSDRDSQLIFPCVILFQEWINYNLFAYSIELYLGHYLISALHYADLVHSSLPLSVSTIEGCYNAAKGK